MHNHDRLTGTVLPGRFESVRLLGRGGMGAVFLAWDPVLCRHVAVKTLAQELAGDAVMRERFAREAELAGRLGAHPHIVTAHEAGEWQQRPYVVFEYMPGGSLADELRAHGAPPRSRAMQWLAQAAEALDYAHAEKVVHRDVKPANLLLDAAGNINVADFGVSRHDSQTTLTAQGEVVGTAGYLAPEQLDDRGATAASDRFALGVVAYQLLTGKLPATTRVELESRVETVFDGALADEPDRRYPTAAAFVDALGAANGADPERTMAARTRARTRLLPARTTPGVRPALAPAPARHKQRSRPWRAAVLLVIAVAVAVPATVGGVLLGRKYARSQAVAAVQAREIVTRCAVQPFGADANLVVSGVGAIRFCRLQAETLSTRSDAWAYRDNTTLQAPDSGDPTGLTRICGLARGKLVAAVYDDLGRRIGTDLCHTYAASGWAVRT